MEDSDLPTRPRSLGRLVNFAAGAVNAMCNRMLEPHGLSLPQWVVLSALWQKAPLTVGQIADYSGNNLPATSKLIDRMVDKGLLARQQDPADRRTIWISLTDRSEDLRHLKGFHETVNRRIADGLSTTETDSLFSLLEHIERACQDPER
ncbi:MAG: MarR family transcriptional regulator [Pseudomonadota bacterium]